MVNEYPLECR